LFVREPFGYRELTSMAIIFAGIVLIRWSEMNRKLTVTVPAADEAGAIPVEE
jgi:drug/metabolite transporter (DMT)-like permease